MTPELLAEDQPLRFVHPLVRSAIYEQLAPGARAQAHAHAARLLIRHSAGYELVAAQLLLCEPAGAPDAVRALRAAAAPALARGAPETAVTYLRRALAEPPAESDHADVVSELGGAERIARDPAAVVHLEQAWQATTNPIKRARLASELADVLFYAADLTRSSAVLQAGLDDLGDREPDLAVRLHAHRAAVELLRMQPTHEVMLKRLSELAAEGTVASRCAQLVLAAFFAARGEKCHEVAGLVAHGLADGRFLAEETCEALPAMVAFWALILTDELDGAYELAEAEADARAALELATEHDLRTTVPLYAGCLAVTLLERGRLDQAAAVVEEIMLEPTVVELPTGGVLLEARGRVRLARGQRAQAVADLRHGHQVADRSQLYNPNFLAWRSMLALALVPEHPREARELARTELEVARRVGSPRAMGIALRVCGLLAGGQAGIELLTQSVAALEPTPMRLELAHSLTELGAALRRSGARTAACEPLRRALDLAARCGARPLAERVREEALAAGARPRRQWTSGVHALTPCELRVARLAAQAMGNREIAQALFITTKTVSDHLSSTYRKLGIASRDELAPAMAAHAT